MNKEVQDAILRYVKHFDEPYSYCVGIHKTDEEIIEEINQCIKTNTPQNAEPDYDKDNIY